MSQSSYSFSPTITRSAYQSFVSGLFAAIQSGNSGASAPSETAAGMVWIDTAGAEIVVKMRDKANTGWVAIWPPSAVVFDPTGTGLAATDIDAALRELAGDVAARPASGTLPHGALATAAASSVLDFTDMDDADAQGWVFTLENIRPSADGASLYLRLSNDNGSSFRAGGEYFWSSWRHGTVLDATQVRAATQNQIEIVGSVGAAAGETGFSGEVTILRPQNALGKTSVTVSGVYIATDGAMRSAQGGGLLNVAEANDAARFLYSSGQIASGTISARKIMRPT